MTKVEYVNGLMQKRCNFSASAIELYLPCTNPLMSQTYALQQTIHIYPVSTLENFGNIYIKGVIYSWDLFFMIWVKLNPGMDK